jgi:hypothetical protein
VGWRTTVPIFPVRCDFAAYVASVFVKSSFLTKNLCAYTMNFLRQEKCLRDHESHMLHLCALGDLYPWQGAGDGGGGTGAGDGRQGGDTRSGG